MVKVEGVDPQIDKLLEAAHAVIAMDDNEDDSGWERPMVDILRREYGNRRVLVQLERTHDDGWTARWKADDISTGRHRGSTTGKEFPAYSVLMAGERLADLLSALDYWLLTGDGRRLNAWE